ncbi:hypothetical protein E2C01_001677 [Portunus trituberculatus]|uniref:Uncharacterized protein n=1 Tax=Portunus trituberculatus TaxID=210409 RepID=A0A5B7CIE3_PORTR|nr:hypothetical protein [Portunus trituberculatus]
MMESLSNSEFRIDSASSAKNIRTRAGVTKAQEKQMWHHRMTHLAPPCQVHEGIRTLSLFP